MAKLIFILDDEQEIEVPLPQQVTVGRQEGNDVVVDDPRISSRHAVIVRDRQGNYEVRDLGSKAGTFVNGVRSEKRLLHPGDKLSFGPLKCLFLMEPTEKLVPVGNPPAGRVGHPVLTGILESTSVGAAAEQEGPRLTGNAFSGGLSGDDASAAPGGAPRQQGGGSSTFVAPRPTQPHPSVSSPRSLRDEPVERKSAASSKPAAKGASGMLKSLLRTVGAIKPVEPEDDLPPAAKNTVTPRTMPPQRDERLRTTSPGTGASRASRFQETDASSTQRATSHSHETSSGVKPLAGINRGPQPKGATPQGQPGVDASGDVIERVPVYTYAVQPKTRQPAPEENPAQPHNLVPAAPQALIPPVSQPSVVSPLAPPPVVAPESSKGGLSPLPPMPTGMARPALPPLPALPASFQAAAMKPAPSAPTGDPDSNTPASFAGSESLPLAPIQTQISGPKVRINTGSPASPGANLPVAAAPATPVLGASPLSKVLGTPLKVSSTPPSAPATPSALAPVPAAAPSEPKVTPAESSPGAEASPAAIRPVVSLTPVIPEVSPAAVPSTPVSDSKSTLAIEPKPAPPSSPSEASASPHTAPVLEDIPVKMTSSAFDLPPILETSESETPVDETKDKPTSEEAVPVVDKMTPAPESSPADPKPEPEQMVSEAAAVASAPEPSVVPVLVPVKAETESSSVPLPAGSGSSSPPALPTEPSTSESSSGALSPAPALAPAPPSPEVPAQPQPPVPPVAKVSAVATALTDAGKEAASTVDIPSTATPTFNSQSSMDAQRAQVSQLVKDLEGKQSNLMQSLRALTDRKHSTQAEMERMMNEVKRSAAELDGLKNQIAARQEEFYAIDRETQSRHAHLTQLTAEQQRLAPITTVLQAAEVRHNELVVTLNALGEQREAREADLQRAAEELQRRSQSVAQLHADEQRLSHVSAALAEGEGRYGELVVALQSLAEQHDATHQNLKVAAEEVHAKNERINQLAAQDGWYIQSIAHRQAELSDAEHKLTETLEAINQGVARNEELVRGLEHLDAACAQRQQELQQLIDAGVSAGVELENVRGTLADTENQVRVAQEHFSNTEALQRGLESDIEGRNKKIAELELEDSRLQTEIESLKERELAFQGAANDAESKHAGWLTAIQALGLQHDQKQAEIQRLHNASEAALRELEAMTSNKEQMSVHLLSLLKEQEAIDSRLAHLRKQSDDADARAATLKALVEKREDEARQKEKELSELDAKRTSLDERIAALTGTEEKLLEAKQQLTQTGESQKKADEDLSAVQMRLQAGQGEATELDSRIGELKQRLEGLHIEITESRASLARDQKTHEDFTSLAEDARAKQESYREALDKQLETLRADLARESQKLAEVMSQREELDRQCTELADTGAKLAETKAGLQHSEAQKSELDSHINELQGKRDGLEQIVGGLHGDEESTKGRLEVLRGREKDLRQVLDELAERERNERERFEAIRRLTAEADKEHNEQREGLLAKLDGKRRELADLEMKLTPLREWKECMDIRYARLASLPEDSESARELWREIESEKSNLRNLISASPGSTRSVSLGEAVLRGLSAPGPQGSGAGEDAGTQDSTGEGAASSRKGRFGINREDSDSPEERGNVGNTGTGAMHSGTGQEMALKARLNRLRESVQREATRLEFLRQERAREEVRTKSGATGESMLREQDRQLESKLRREEERYATLQRKLELAEVEEEKRRDRITEMERKIAELKSDIVDAERERGTARHHAEIAQVELKSQEDNLKRATDSPQGEETSVLASLIGARKNRGPSNLKPMGTPKE